MSDELENNYSGTDDPKEKASYREASTSMLKGWARINSQPRDVDDTAVRMWLTGTREGKDVLRKMLFSHGWDGTTNMDGVEEAHVENVALIVKATGMSVRKAAQVSADAIGSVTDGLVRPKKTPDEVEEAIGSAEHFTNRTSPGMPNAQISTQGN